MDLGLRGRVALVTGASLGLGRAIAHALAAEGARVAVAARNAERLEAAAREIAEATGAEVMAVPADVAVQAEVDAMVQRVADRWGGLHVLGANAGGPPGTRFEQTAAPLVEEALRLNLLSTVHMAHASVPHMKSAGWGRFIALTSMTVKQPMPGLILSNTARAGVVGWVKTMATELAPLGITCNVVAPGYFRTGRVEELAGQRSASEGRPAADILAEMDGRIPMRRMGEPEELGAVVAFLASERASYLTGVTLQVDGGVVQGLL
jgi:3-oxoacyl-[acyl-carrier protein] reductase